MVWFFKHNTERLKKKKKSRKVRKYDAQIRLDNAVCERADLNCLSDSVPEKGKGSRRSGEKDATTSVCANGVARRSRHAA